MVEKLGSEDGGAAAVARQWPCDPEFVQVDYEGEEPLAAIADRHGISRYMLDKMATELGWRRRYKRPIDRGLVISRMLRMVELSVARLEEEMKSPTEKEAALLGSLARTLDKLIELDDAEKGRAAANDRKAGDLAQLRHQLARRIEGLKRR